MTRRGLLPAALAFVPWCAAAVRAGPPGAVYAPPLLLEAPGGPGTLRVTNLGQAVVEVAATIQLEARHEAGWMATTSAYYYMMERCTDPEPVSAARAALRPGVPSTVAPWTGWSCSGQCHGACRGNIPMEGTYRPVLIVLPSGVRVPGPVWEMRPLRNRRAAP